MDHSWLRLLMKEQKSQITSPTNYKLLPSSNPSTSSSAFQRSHDGDSQEVLNRDMKERCMTCFRLLHSHLKLLSNKDLAGTYSEFGFKRAFPSFFGENIEIFTNEMFLNIDHLEKQLNKEELHENESKVTFCVLKNQFQQFIHTRLYTNDDYLFESKYFLEYTRLGFQKFKDILLQLMDSIEKLIVERIFHEKEYNRRVNERKF